MLLRTLWLSLDPYMRGRMSDPPSYAKPVGIGEVMEGGTVSEVVASNVPRFAKAISSPRPRTPSEPPSDAVDHAARGP
jgi:NADPH-dependent curcumin reductase CurA